MKHSVASFEREIVHQIFLCELCLDICDSIPGFPGLGSHFLPYFYNLNFKRSIDSLHGLLLSRGANELSFKNYIKLRKLDKYKPDAALLSFESKIDDVSSYYKTLMPYSIRNKVSAHLDGDFKHSDFTAGYLLPHILSELIGITNELKSLFLLLTKHALADDPYGRLRSQAHDVVDKFTIEVGQSVVAERRNL